MTGGSADYEDTGLGAGHQFSILNILLCPFFKLMSVQSIRRFRETHMSSRVN